jgi:hypothetical protein
MSKLVGYIFGSSTTSTASKSAANGVKLNSNGSENSTAMIIDEEASAENEVDVSDPAPSEESPAATNGDADPLSPPQETTELLSKVQGQNSNQEKITARDYYFPPNNPTIQRYYRFSPTPASTFAALHKRPGHHDAGSVAGLLYRAAVIPSHGTDPTGEWILVSVGGRSGWARKRRSTAVGGFVVARQFQASESWMANHVFLLGGKIMLGSDAPLFLFVNGLLTSLIGIYLFWLLPKLEDPAWLLTVRQNFILTCVLFLISIINFWICATMDPGILPPLSSPIKPPIPNDGNVGGPLGHRYCATCNIFRPPRSKHCNSCNVCVSRFDQ